MRLITHGDRETQGLGQALGERLCPGDLVLLFGDMGAGKSELCRGIARGLGISGPIPSPTFTIMQMYSDGRVPLYHFDWYRLSGSDELYEMGMDEFLTGDGVALVEWPTRALDAVPETYLKIAIDKGDGDEERLFTLTPIGGFRNIAEGNAFECFGG